MPTTIVPDHHLPHPQYRIRHIKSIQVRNLTPFPARDAIAQSLTQPSRNSVFVPHSTDDIELGIFRRKRRISSSSAIVSYNHETDEDESTPLTRSSSTQRRRSGSKSSLRTVSGSPSTSRRLSSNHHSSFIATRHVVSFAEDDASHALDTQTPSPLFVIHSQKHLEKIISSRLIETFITLSSLTSAEDRPSSRTSFTPSPLPTPLTTPSFNTTVSPNKKLKEVPVKKVPSTSKSDHRKGPSVSSAVSHKSTPSVPRTPASPTSAPRSRTGERASTSRAGFTSPPTPPPESPKTKHHNFSSSKTVSSRPSSRGADARQDGPSPLPPTPFYISSIHQPSTNPTFAHLDPEREFANWADITASRFQVAIWGRTDKSDTDLKSRGKDTVTQSVLGSTFTWQILDEWTVDLDAATLFSPDSSGHTLPSNTLLITLASGDTFRVLPKSAEYHSTAASQSQDPSVDRSYNSDTELDGLLAREENSQRARDLIARNMRETRMKKSATYQDLVKLINLQTVIADTQQLLDNTIRTCNFLIESDRHDPSRREISELEDWVRTLHDERAKVRESIERDSVKLEERRKMLRRRREHLASAKDIYRQNIEEYSDTARTLAAEQERHSNLASQIPTLRTSLIQLVNFIFPIEPVSPPDLLFSILDSPLPVPTSPKEPAPPMSMSAFPAVSEESVSTALGYVAQVTQLISAYLGQRLVYPVTCYGSRSVIKDPISAMAGPRIFPLYSKGVETYRFEYGVFLLNKDIELLMSERNLRALDIRHTLPNLKNLILTLTTADEIEKPVPERKRFFEVSEISSPVSPSAAREEMNDSSTTSPTSSGQQPLKKSAPFFYPFTSLLRSRYPSSLGRPKVKPVDETTEQPEDSPPPEDSTPPASDLALQIHVTAEDESKDLPAGGELPATVNRNPLEKSTSNSEATSPSPSLPEVA